MSIAVNVNYHVRKNEPQFFRFDADGAPGNLISPELRATPIEVTDIRQDSEDRLRFNKDGVEFLKSPSSVSGVPGSSEWEEPYSREIEDLLKSQIGAAQRSEERV